MAWSYDETSVCGGIGAGLLGERMLPWQLVGSLAVLGGVLLIHNQKAL